MSVKRWNYRPRLFTTSFTEWLRQAALCWGSSFPHLWNSLAVQERECCFQPRQDRVRDQRPRRQCQACVFLGGSTARVSLWSSHPLLFPSFIPEQRSPSLNQLRTCSLLEGPGVTAALTHKWALLVLQDVSTLEIIFIFSAFSMTYDASIKTLTKLKFRLIIVLMLMWNACDLTFPFSFLVFYQWCCRIQSGSWCHESNWLQTWGDSDSV